MQTYLSKIVRSDIETVINVVSKQLETAEFEVINRININGIFKEKLNTNFRAYNVLVVCNPTLAYKALLYKDKLGTLLPCIIIIQETHSGVEVAIPDPISSLQYDSSPEICAISYLMKNKLKTAIENL